MFSLQQNWRRKGWNRFWVEARWGVKGKVPQTMYIPESKSKNDKIEREKKNKRTKIIILISSQLSIIKNNQHIIIRLIFS
jgi:hypothetical protein